MVRFGSFDKSSVAAPLTIGVAIEVPDDTMEAIIPEFKEGARVTLTGEKAEKFVRHRDIDVSHSAIARMERQVVFMKAFADKAQSVAADDAMFIVEMLEEIEPYTVTNIGRDMFAKMLESSYNEEDIYRLPGETVVGEYFDEYHINEDALFELILQMFYKEVQDE